MASQGFARWTVYLCILLMTSGSGLTSYIDGSFPATTTLKIERRLVARVQNGSRMDTGPGSASVSSMRARTDTIDSASSTTAKSSMTFFSSLSTEPLKDVRFSSAPLETGIEQAEQCWSDIMTWRNSSASWYNTHIANRTWPLERTSETVTWTWASSSTYYPANVSTYTLCDGTPRADVRPVTSHWSGTDSSWNTFSTIVTPTFRPQPCTPSPEMCRLWYYESNIKAKDEHELLRQCGKPAHAGAPCLIGGGPVQLYYFPVTPTSTALLCGPNTTANASIPLPTPAPSTIPPITTHGHTFHPQRAYISFHTLYASYDGFWDRLGPEFSDFIMPLASSEISTHCGGWWEAFGHGTQLNYADLNWPVPASAYKCQHRCSSTWTSDCASGCDNYVTSDVQHCGTIWSDVDPVLAVPTRVRELAPEWKECRFWDEDIPNFWFDPPVALQQGEGQAMPTTPRADSVTTTKAEGGAQAGLTTKAAPSSNEVGALPEKTGTAGDSGSELTAPLPEETQDAGTGATNADPDGPANTDQASNNDDGETGPGNDESDAQLPPADPKPTDESTPRPSQGPQDSAPAPSPHEQGDADNPDPASQGGQGSQDTGSQSDPDRQNDPSIQDPSDPNADSQPEEQPSPSQVTAPALSILASALDSAGPGMAPSVQSLMSSAQGAAESVLHPNPTPTNDAETPATGADTLVTLGHTTLAISQVSALSDPDNDQGGSGGEAEGQPDGGVIIGPSLTLSAGQTTTVSGVPVAVYIFAILWGSTFVPLPAATDAGEEVGPGSSTLAYGGLTLTATPAPAAGTGAASSGGDAGAALSIGGTVISPGGPAAVIDGTTISRGLDGEVVVYGESSTGTMTRVAGAASATGAGTSGGVEGSGGLPDVTTASATSAGTAGATRSPSSTDGDGDGDATTTESEGSGPAITTVGSSGAVRTRGGMCSASSVMRTLEALFCVAMILMYTA